MLHKILVFLGLAAALLIAPRANADGIYESDADTTPYYSHDVHVGEGLKLNAGGFPTFDLDLFKGPNSDFIHGLHEFSWGVPKTAEWIWWLDHYDYKGFSTDPVVNTPEPASLFLLGSGMLALGAWRRRANHSAPVS